MQRLKALNKDHQGALMLIILGVAVLWLGYSYRMGNLNRMGAGFIPVVLGVLMIFIGILIGVTSTPASRLAAETEAAMSSTIVKHGAPEWRGWLCILGGVVAFVVFGMWGGLVPATFASVFVSALGDRQNNVKHSAVLAAGLTVFCVIVFHYGLKLQLPLFQWGQ